MSSNDEENPSVRLRAEFKPLLSSVTITLDFDRHVISLSSRLEVTSHTIQVSTKNSRILFSLENLTLTPSSCRNLCWIGAHELQLTLMAIWRPGLSCSGDASSSLNGCTEEDTKHAEPFNQDHLVDRIKRHHPHCFCVGCGAQILSSACHFKRILPLPSENWSDFADIWFCHNHSNGHNHEVKHDPAQSCETLRSETACGENTVPEKLQHVCQSGLVPRSDDCLVSSLYMMLSARHVNPTSVVCVADRLICKRCGNFLGFVKLGDADGEGKSLQSFLDDPLNGVYKIYFHTVSFGEDSRNVGPHMLKVPYSDNESKTSSPREQSVEDFICGLLKDQSRVFTSFRFFLHSSPPSQGKGQSGLDLLLWLLDQELYLYSAGESTQDVKASHGVKCESSTVSPSPKLQLNVRLKPTKYMKILYKVDFWPDHLSKQRNSPDVFTAWQKDNTVHGLSLPQPLCQQVLSLLISSTSQLHTYQRSLNGFHVGYLRSS